MKNSFKTSRFLIILVLLFTLVLSSCGSAEDSYNSVAGSIEKADGEYTNTTNKDTALGTDGTTVPQDKTAKIIRDVNITGETKNFDEAIEKTKQQIADFDGYVEKSEVSGGKHLSDNRHIAKNANFTIRIPAEKLDGFLEETNALLNVTNSSESTKDVTLSYYDIESRLNTLKTKKTALESMLEQATNLDDMLLIQDNLYNVIADIESYQSQLNLYDNKVNYSTVTLRINEVIEYTVIEAEEPTFGERIANAFTNGWVYFGEFCQDFSVLLVALMPLLIILIIVIAIVITVKKNKKKKQCETVKEEQDQPDNEESE